MSIISLTTSLGFAAIEPPQATLPNEQSTIENNKNLIRLSLAKQALAGLKTRPLVGSRYQTELQASANVIDIQPLLNLREQYFAAQIEAQSASTAITLSQKAITRTQELYRNGVNSHRQLQEQQMTHNALQARLAINQYRLQSINNILTVNWGDRLSEWAKANNNVEFQNFINGQQALLLVSLPAGNTLPKGSIHITVDPNSERQNPQTADFVASAPQGSESSQGETYFFKAPRAKLRTGMRLSAWIAKQNKTLTGFNIPTAALVWHAGLATIYVKTAPEYFQRFSLINYYPIDSGYFVAEPLPINTEVVVSGVQILLSHEFRTLIPAEDNDGDD
ncbi:MAG: hypothetical protein HOP02_00610 [Methylococcaceae bacterium]|nr:hypothetical protein [Methylococcaceae bacterium]